MSIFVWTTHYSEGDGPQALVQSLYAQMTSSHHPNVTALATKLAGGNSSHQQQLSAYPRACIAPAYTHFQTKFDNDLKPTSPKLVRPVSNPFFLHTPIKSWRGPFHLAASSGRRRREKKKERLPISTSLAKAEVCRNCRTKGIRTKFSCMSTTPMYLLRLSNSHLRKRGDPRLRYRVRINNDALVQLCCAERNLFKTVVAKSVPPKLPHRFSKQLDISPYHN